VRPAIARYDGYSDWYDETFSATHPAEQESWFRACLGAGGGAVCLDVACGTGRAGRVRHRRLGRPRLGRRVEYRRPGRLPPQDPGQLPGRLR